MEKTSMPSIDDGPPVDLYVTVMAGRWIRLINGSWEFKIDMSRSGRSINCRNIGSSEELRISIASSYGIDAKVISVEMTYWIEDLLAERFGVGSTPVQIVTDRCYRQFKSLYMKDRSLNIFVTFWESIGDRLVIIGEGRSKMKKVDPENRVEEGGNTDGGSVCDDGCLTADPEETYSKCGGSGVQGGARGVQDGKCSGYGVQAPGGSGVQGGKSGVQDGKCGVEGGKCTDGWGSGVQGGKCALVEDDEGLEEVEWTGDEDGEDGNCDGDEEEETGKGENIDDDEDDYDEEDYDYDRWHEFVRNDCEWSSQELDWGSQESELIYSQLDVCGQIHLNGSTCPQKEISRQPPELIHTTEGSKSGISQGTIVTTQFKGVEKGKGKNSQNQKDYRGKKTKESTGNPRGLISYHGDDDFVCPPRRMSSGLGCSRDNGGSGLKKGMSVTEVYGYADLEPLFKDTELSVYKLHDVDLSREDDDIYMGRVFKDKEEFKMTMAIYAIRRLFRFVYSRHAKNSVTASCITPRCDWRVYAVRIGDLDDYEVRKAHLTHRCDVDTRGQFSKHATSKVIASLLRTKYETIYGGPRARELPEMMLKAHNITVSYWKCWKAKELAIVSSRGTEESSFRLLPLYLYVIKLANPDSITHLVTAVDGKGNPRFKYCFLALGASIDGWKHLRKVIVIDGTHLHGKYKGCLMTASGQDSNFQIFPIAFAVVDSENDDAWHWFMEKLSSIVEDSSELTIISDRNQSIYYGKNIVYPKAHHGACLVHLQRNVQSKYGKAMKEMVGRAGQAFRVGQFKRFYEVIKRKNFRTWDYLEKIGLEHWTRSHCMGQRYNLMSSNIAESLNKALLPGRDCPIISLLEFIRKMLSRWMESRREVIGKMDGQIPEEVAKELEIRLQDSIGLSTVKCSPWDFEVSTGSASTFQFRVDLLNKTCTCREFELIKIPCRHAMAAARFHGVEYKGLVDDVYKKNVWASTVAGVILPVPDPDDIFIPEEIRNREVFPPITRRQSGRPPKKRILSTGEFEVKKKKKKPNKCGRCARGGHNRVTCTEALD